MKFNTAPAALVAAIFLALIFPAFGQNSIPGAEAVPASPKIPLLLPGGPAVSPLEARFRDALYAEEAKQDLKAAAAAYQEIIDAFDRDRETAASALYRLAEVHRKENRTEAAIACFRRVALRFPDREPLARMARENITLLGGIPPEAGADPAFQPPTSDPEQDKALAKLQELHRTSPDLLLNVGTSLKTNGCISYDEAIQAGYLRVVTFFLEHGASADKTPAGEAPLVVAAEYAQKAVIDLLLNKGAAINGTDAGKVPLAAAARSGHLAIVQQLLDKGAEVNGRKDGNAPLSLAVEAGHKSVMELLLAKGADPNQENGQALIGAVLLKRVELVSLLLENRADPNPGKVSYAKNPKRFESGQNPSALPGVENTGSLNLPQEYTGYLQQNNQGRIADTFHALHLACLSNSLDIVKLLLAKGADVNAATEGGSTPLELACALNFFPIAELMVQADAKGDVQVPGGLRLIDLGLHRGEVKWYDLLRKAGAVVTGESSNGMTSLEALCSPLGYLSAWKGDPAVLFSRLLDDGADANGNARFRPVLFAAKTGLPELLKLLQAHGADFKPPGAVPPVIAVILESLNNRIAGTVNTFTAEQEETVKALLAGGADLNARYNPEDDKTNRWQNWANRSALELLVTGLPDAAGLERFLAFQPGTFSDSSEPKTFARAVKRWSDLTKEARRYAEADEAAKKLGPSVGRVIIPPSAYDLIGPDSWEEVLKSAPAMLERLWYYEKITRNTEFAERVWIQAYELDRDDPVYVFMPAAAPGKGAVSLAEALALGSNAVGNGGEMWLPDLAKLEVLVPDAATGRLTVSRTIDLVSLAAAQAAEASPMLQPGEVLSLKLTGEKIGSWRDFPEPVAGWMRRSLTREITVKAGDWTRVFKVVPEVPGFRWDPAADLLAVPPTMRTLLRYLPKPEWFYRRDSVQLTPPGGQPETVDLTKPLPEGEEPELASGTQLMIQEIPADDPALAKRRSETIFVSSPKDGFLRDVFRRKAVEGLPESEVTAMDVLGTFYEESESVIPFPDLESLTFRGKNQDKEVIAEPWGGELAVRTLDPLPAESREFTLSRSGKPDSFPIPASQLFLKMNLPSGQSGRSKDVVLTVTEGLNRLTEDGWVLEQRNAGESGNPVGRERDCSISAPTLQAVSARLFAFRKSADRFPDRPRYLVRDGMEKPLAFRPDESPLPFVRLRDGDRIMVDPSDQEYLINENPPAPVQSRPGGRRIVLPGQR